MSSDKINKPPDDYGTLKRHKVKRIPNQLAVFKFPITPDPAVKSAYESRKVNVINKRRFINPNHKTQDEFFGTLHLYK